MNKNIAETLTGAFVIIVAVWFLSNFVTNVSNFQVNKDDYTIIAKFENVDGVEPGSSIMIGGVKVGVVLDKQLDKDTYFAIIKMAVNKDIQIPTDSSAKISSSGLLGEKFISIVPGAEESFLSDNQEIKFTQSSMNLETLIGKMIFMKNSDKAN